MSAEEYLEYKKLEKSYGYNAYLIAKQYKEDIENYKWKIRYYANKLKDRQELLEDANIPVVLFKRDSEYKKLYDDLILIQAHTLPFTQELLKSVERYIQLEYEYKMQGIKFEKVNKIQREFLTQPVPVLFDKPFVATQGTLFDIP